MERVELLAPARDLETGLAAINCGADAVYIGATRFGAREAARNDLEAIEALARYAHKYWARVYVTVNTLLYDEELSEAERLIRRLYEIGVDGLIVQDVGLLELDLPPLPLIASTQMHNHTPERVRFLEEVGFQRAILARELTLDEIRRIRAHTHLELECFVHGALCVSYSGQCAMSYCLGGRSGNRGQCAQPCRRRYRLVDGKGRTLLGDRHLLSLRDLNLSDHLEELLAAGIRSFKIEGRLKDKTYVMNVVGHYRQRLDAILEGLGLRPASSGRCRLGFEPDPLKTFNRGYTSYFLHGRGAPLTSWDTPKWLGEMIGRVRAVDQRSFTLEGAISLRRGDGLSFLGPGRELYGTTVTAVEGSEVFPQRMDGLTVGALIYRNHDHAFYATLDKAAPTRAVAVTLRLEATPQGLALSARDEDANEASAELACKKVPAEKPKQALATIEKQLRSLGGSGFACTRLEIDLPEIYFLPVAALNDLRRRTLEQLALARERNRPRPAGGALRNDVPFPEQELSYLGNVLNRRAEDFYRRHGVTRIEPAAESGLDLRGRKVMTTRYCLRYELDGCPREPGAKRLAEPLRLVDEQGTEFLLRFDCLACQMQIYLSAGC